MGFRGIIAIWLCTSLSGLSATPPPAPSSRPAPTPPAWENTVTRLPRGTFPNPPPFVATYNFGWNGIVAATGEIEFNQPADRLQLFADGGTVGVARVLWRFDVHHRALVDAATLRPVRMHQVEITRGKTVTTDLAFQPNQVESIRTNSKSKKAAKPKTFFFSGGIFDMLSTMLYLRSQPLRVGDVYRLVVYPASSPYLATLTVAGHAPIRVTTGTYPAFRFDIRLSKIAKDGKLEPHKKFRSASLWVSDDANRMLLRVEASIFVGTVFAELQSIRSPENKP